MATTAKPLKLSKPVKEKPKADPSNWHIDKMKKTLRDPGIVLPLIEQHLLQRAVDHKSDRDVEHIHPSEMAKADWCPRSTWFRIKHFPIEQEDHFSFRLQNIFEEGHDIHNKWQTWAWDAGILEGLWHCLNPDCGEMWLGLSPHVCRSCGSNMLRYGEYPIFNEDYRIIGHADGVLLIDGVRYIWELKSLGVNTLKFEAPTLFKQYEAGELTLNEMWRNIKRPLPAHRRQGGLYAHLLGIPRVIFVYEWKPTQEYKEFPPVDGFNEDSTEGLLASAKAVVQGLDSGFPPLRPQWASSPDNATCKKCPYVKACWEGGNDDTNEDAPVKEVAVATTGQRSRLVRRGSRR